MSRGNGRGALLWSPASLLLVSPKGVEQQGTGGVEHHFIRKMRGTRRVSAQCPLVPPGHFIPAPAGSGKQNVREGCEWSRGRGLNRAGGVGCHAPGKSTAVPLKALRGELQCGQDPDQTPKTGRGNKSAIQPTNVRQLEEMALQARKGGDALFPKVVNGAL